MRSTGAFLVFSIGRTIEILLLFHGRTATEIHFLSAIGAIHQSRKRAHFTHIRRTAFCFPNSLDGFKSLLIDDRFLRVFKDNPVLSRYVNALFRLIRLLIRLEVDGATCVLQVFKYIRNRSLTPYSRILSKCQRRW